MRFCSWVSVLGSFIHCLRLTSLSQIIATVVVVGGNSSSNSSSNSVGSGDGGGIKLNL